MLENCKTREERWGGVETLIEGWLKERQELIVLYCSLSGAQAVTPGKVRQVQKLKKFCEILVDYVSAGHFEIYDQLLKEAEDFQDGGEQLASKIYPKLTKTTEIALDFNDKYDTEEHCKDLLAQLANELSRLGEVLVSRFEMEDQLIQVLHTQHASQVA